MRTTRKYYEYNERKSKLYWLQWYDSPILLGIKMSQKNNNNNNNFSTNKQNKQINKQSRKNSWWSKFIRILYCIWRKCRDWTYQQSYLPWRWRPCLYQKRRFLIFRFHLLFSPISIYSSVATTLFFSISFQFCRNEHSPRIKRWTHFKH